MKNLFEEIDSVAVMDSQRPRRPIIKSDVYTKYPPPEGSARRIYFDGYVKAGEPYGSELSGFERWIFEKYDC